MTLRIGIIDKATVGGMVSDGKPVGLLHGPAGIILIGKILINLLTRIGIMKIGMMMIGITTKRTTKIGKDIHGGRTIGNRTMTKNGNKTRGKELVENKHGIHGSQRHMAYLLKIAYRRSMDSFRKSVVRLDEKGTK
jgi:hypothetical protein